LEVVVRRGALSLFVAAHRVESIALLEFSGSSVACFCKIEMAIPLQRVHDARVNDPEISLDDRLGRLTTLHPVSPTCNDGTRRYEKPKFLGFLECSRNKRVTV
jgi:hypothetical protein